MKQIDWARLTDRATTLAVVTAVCAVTGWVVAPERLEAILAVTTAAGVVLGIWAKAPTKKDEGQ